MTDNNTNLEDNVNYLLSGPGGLGQSFAGYSSYDPVQYLTGNFRTPFSQTTTANLYVSGIGVNNAVQLDSRTIKYFFTGAPLGSVPFALGNGLKFTGISPSAYNSADLTAAGTSIQQIGVVECTTSYVIVRTVDAILQSLGTYASGGTIQYNVMDSYNSTDCDVRVTVTGATDRVFVSAQLDQKIDYQVVTASADMTVYTAIRRYKAFINNDPVNPDFIFQPDAIVVEKAYPYTALTGTGSLNLIETVFSSIQDKPSPGYYRYILEVYFQTFGASTDIYVTQDELRVRSISAQVVKQ